MVPMVDHEPSLPTVDADVFAGDEAGLVGGQEQYHVGDVQGVADTACGLLGGIGAGIDGIGGVDPAGGDGVDPDTPGKAHRQGVG